MALPDKNTRLIGPITISAQNTFTDPIFVEGGANLDIAITGTAGSTITIQKCLGAADPVDASFVDAAGTILYNKMLSIISGAGGWYRAGVKTGDFATNAIITMQRSEGGTGNGQNLQLQTDSKGNVQNISSFYLAKTTASITRPSDTTTYAALDQIDSVTASTGLTFASAVRQNGASGRIIGMTLAMSTAATLKLVGNLALYTAMPTLSADNAATSVSDAENRTCVGIIPFSNPSVMGANVFYTVYGLNIPFTAGSATTSIFGILQATNAYIPASAEIFDVVLLIAQN